MTNLLAGRFSRTTAEIIEQFAAVEGIGVYWALESFGLDRIELTVNALSAYDAFDRYDNHLGQRLAIYDNTLSYVISGWITEIEILSGNRVRYVARGPVFRMDDRYIVRSWPQATLISTVISEIVTGFMYFVDADHSGIIANGIAIGGWDVQRPTGSTPAQAIRELCNLSDYLYRIRDFWLVDEPIKGIALQQYLAHYAPRTTTDAVDWVVYRRDMQAPRFARSIENLATSVRVYHGLLTGTITGLTATTLTDSSATFITNSVQPGDMIVDQTVGGSASILGVVSETVVTISPWRAKQIGRATSGTTTTLVDTTVNFTDVGVVVGDILYNLTDSSTGTITGITTTTNTDDTLEIGGAMSGGKANGVNERYEVKGNQDVGDDYAIRTKADTNYQEASVTIESLWTREITVSEPSMDATQALQYANSLLIDEPQQLQAFTVTSPTIEDATGARWPIWTVIAKGGGVIRAADLFPDADSLAGTANRSTVFRITHLEYKAPENSLRIGVDSTDRRLDARLKRERIVRSAGLL